MNSIALAVGFRSANLAAAANSERMESRFFPAWIATSDTPRDKTTQRFSTPVSETKFQSTASAVVPSIAAKSLVDCMRRTIFSAFRASGLRIKDRVFGLAKASTSS